MDRIALMEKQISKLTVFSRELEEENEAKNSEIQTQRFNLELLSKSKSALEYRQEELVSKYEREKKYASVTAGNRKRA